MLPEERPDQEIIENDQELDKWVEAYERRMSQEASKRKADKIKMARQQSKLAQPRR